jgi:hypothetical protein
MLLPLLIAGCPAPRGPAPSDDDDATDDDDVASTPPLIQNIAACQRTVVGQDFILFTLGVQDAEGDLLAPVQYSIALDIGPPVAFVSGTKIGESGELPHSWEVGTGGVEEGETHDFHFRVFDAAGNASALASVTLTADGGDPC